MHYYSKQNFLNLKSFLWVFISEKSLFKQVSLSYCYKIFIASFITISSCKNLYNDSRYTPKEFQWISKRIENEQFLFVCFFFFSKFLDSKTNVFRRKIPLVNIKLSKGREDFSFNKKLAVDTLPKKYSVNWLTIPSKNLNHL